MHAPSATRTRDPRLAEFVDRFSEAWAKPDLDAFEALTHPEVVLEQPITPRVVGRSAQRESFRRLLSAFPGIRGEVLDWSGGGDRLYITLRLSVPAGRRPLEWTLVDRIELEDGLVRRRTAHFDSAPLLVGSLLRPSLWRGLARVMLRRR